VLNDSRRESFNNATPLATQAGSPKSEPRHLVSRRSAEAGRHLNSLSGRCDDVFAAGPYVIVQQQFELQLVFDLARPFPCAAINACQRYALFPGQPCAFTSQIKRISESYIDRRFNRHWLGSAARGRGFWRRCIGQRKRGRFALRDGGCFLACCRFRFFVQFHGRFRFELFTVLNSPQMKRSHSACAAFARLKSRRRSGRSATTVERSAFQVNGGKVTFGRKSLGVKNPVHQTGSNYPGVEVAKRLWKLASYGVAGRNPKEICVLKGNRKRG
jgi:hypothetical protein